MSNEEDKSEYRYKVAQYYFDYLRGVELDEANIQGMQGWHDRCYEYIITTSAELMIDEEKYHNNIYFYIAENRGWYSIHPSKYLYFYYGNKCYEIYLAYGRWDYDSGKYEVCGDVYIHDKSKLNLNLWDLYDYHDRDIRSHNYKDDVQGKFFIFLLEDGQNLISEIIKRFRNKRKPRSRNNSNNKGM